MSSFTHQLKIHQAENRFVFALSLLWLIGVSCGGENIQSGNDQTAHGVNHAIVRRLTVVDSIGTELGDSNYVFGAVWGVTIGPSGDIFVVDWIKCTIFRYSFDGDFIQRIGRRGSGPGEMHQPGNPVVMDDGSICVYDGELVPRQRI
ncbi:MAG: hypothetical protein KAR40_18425 [Candidatus Sabulitectum sp.]|nr:hypothetical protein [Candidatus Sabulitectum sp.]